jgi:hypothetical protein
MTESWPVIPREQFAEKTTVKVKAPMLQNLRSGIYQKPGRQKVVQGSRFIIQDLPEDSGEDTPPPAAQISSLQGSESVKDFCWT